MIFSRRVLLKVAMVAGTALSAGLTAFLQACSSDDGYGYGYGYGYGKKPYGYGYGFMDRLRPRNLDSRTYEGQRVVFSSESTSAQRTDARRPAG